MYSFVECLKGRNRPKSQPIGQGLQPREHLQLLQLKSEATYQTYTTLSETKATARPCKRSSSYSREVGQVGHGQAGQPTLVINFCD